MVNLRLTRIASNPREGTFGAITLDGRPICLTLEPYHRDNERNISSIPSGQYLIKRVDSPTYGNTFEITNIQGRSSVLFHWGNRDDNTQGCILLGEEFGELNGDWAVLSSKKGFNEFIKLMAYQDEAILTIVESY